MAGLGPKCPLSCLLADRSPLTSSLQPQDGQGVGPGLGEAPGEDGPAPPFHSCPPLGHTQNKVRRGRSEAAGQEGANYVTVWGNDTPGTGNSTSKGPEAGRSV